MSIETIKYHVCDRCRQKDDYNYLESEWIKHSELPEGWIKKENGDEICPHCQRNN
jgi:hypothetical protein